MIHSILAELKNNMEFDKWRKEQRKALPELSNRVYSLRGKLYNGCGFHWSLEKDLGYIIKNISDYDSYPSDIDQILLVTITESLYNRLIEIENEIIK